MRYVFFDVECASSKGGTGKLYSLGYLVADDNLNIIENQKDILINPDVQTWDWYVVKNMLAYPKSQIEKRAKFDRHYDKIKNLFEGEDTILCGFAIDNDIGYMLDECIRYNLQPIKCKYFDIQLLEQKLRNDKRIGLDTAYFLWTNNRAKNMHRSDIDAYYTYALAKAICDKNNRTLYSYIEEFNDFSGSTDGFAYGFNNQEKQTRKARKDKSTTKRVREEKEDCMLKGGKNNLLFLRLLDSIQPNENAAGYLAGKKISISLNYEAYNFKNMMKLVELISQAGGVYVKKASTADIFVKSDALVDGEVRECSKYSYVKQAIAEGANIEVMEFEEFLHLVDLNEQKLNELPDKDYEYLMNDKYKREKMTAK